MHTLTRSMDSSWVSAQAMFNMGCRTTLVQLCPTGDQEALFIRVQQAPPSTALIHVLLMMVVAPAVRVFGSLDSNPGGTPRSCLDDV